MKPIDWDIRREGRRWSHEEFDDRCYQAPEKIEFVGGIFTNEEERLTVLAMLLENLGIDKAVRLGKLQDWKAAIAEYFPSLGLTADYGFLGKRPSDTAATYSVVGGLRIPIFQGGRIRGEILQADAALQQRRAELEDLRGRVDFEVRTSFLDVQSAADQLTVARSNVSMLMLSLTPARLKRRCWSRSILQSPNR